MKGFRGYSGSSEVQINRCQCIHRMPHFRLARFKQLLARCGSWIEMDLAD